MMTQEQLADVSKRWLSPIDEVMADLVDKSHRMTIGAFMCEVDDAIKRIPDLWDKLNIDALDESLNDEMVKAFAESLERTL